MPSDVEGENLPPHTTREAEQEELDVKNRRATLVAVLRHNSGGADDLVRLVDMLDLGEELTELVGGDPERHRRLAAAQLKLDETVEAVAHD
jgi:hypothetical protein